MNIFEYATKNKVRFESDSGQLTVEDLWDLKLVGGRVNLDGLAKKYNKKLKEDVEESFVVKKSAASALTKLKFDIVKHIIDLKLEAKEKSAKELEDKAHNQKILKILSDKKDKDLEGKTVEELESMLKN